MKSKFWVTPVREITVVDEFVQKKTEFKNKTVEIIQRTTEVYIEFSCGHKKRKTDFPKGLDAKKRECIYCKYENRKNNQ